ncbi:hypothetical protein Tco_1255196 [Tanacetum coccineum]
MVLSKAKVTIFFLPNLRMEIFIALLVYVDDIIVTRNNVVLETDQGLCLSQKKYCLDLLSDFGLLACKPSATPLEQNLFITNEPTDVDKFMHKPLRSHVKIALRVLRYLKGNPGKGIHIVKQPKTSLEAFVDADWAKCLVTRKSVIGFCIKLNSQAAIKVVVNPVFHERTKHLEIDLHFAREKVLLEVIETQKFNTAVQPADIFTKGLNKNQHENLILKLGLIDVFQLCLSLELNGKSWILEGLKLANWIMKLL